jgi:hypothetical protein
MDMDYEAAGIMSERQGRCQALCKGVALEAVTRWIGNRDIR